MGHLTILGNWKIFGDLESPKSKPALEIGLCKIDRFEKVGKTISQSINMPQDQPERCRGSSIITSKTMT
jgi:hypothetical protein